MFQEAVMIHVGDWVDDRLKNLSEKDKIRFESRSKSGFGKNIPNWLKRDKVYPTNVLHFATECSNRDHSAVFPESLPEWFIKLLTEEGDTVLDNSNNQVITVQVKFFTKPIVILYDPYPLPNGEEKKGTKARSKRKKDSSFY
jgi:hypothetical protein